MMIARTILPTAVSAAGAMLAAAALIAPAWLPEPFGAGFGPTHVVVSSGALITVALSSRRAIPSWWAVPVPALLLGLLANIALSAILLAPGGPRMGAAVPTFFVAALAILIFTTPEAPRSDAGPRAGSNGVLSGLAWTVWLIASLVGGFVYAFAALPAVVDGVPFDAGKSAGALIEAFPVRALPWLVPIVLIPVLIELLRRRRDAPADEEEAAAMAAARDAVAARLRTLAPVASRDRLRWRDAVRIVTLLVTWSGFLFACWLVLAPDVTGAPGAATARALRPDWLVARPGGATVAILLPLALPLVVAAILMPFFLTPPRAARALLCTGPRCGDCRQCTDGVLRGVPSALRRMRGRFDPDAYIVARHRQRWLWVLAALSVWAAFVTLLILT